MNDAKQCGIEGCKQIAGYRIIFASGDPIDVCGIHVKNPDTTGRTAVVIDRLNSSKNPANMTFPHRRRRRR